MNERDEKLIRPNLCSVHRAGLDRYAIRGLALDRFIEGAMLLLETRFSKSGVPFSSQRVIEILTKAPADDLVLRVAFEFGDRMEATEIFDREYSGLIVSKYLQLGAPRNDAEDLKNELIECLTNGAFRRSGEPAILNYAALSPIARWLGRVVKNDYASYVDGKKNGDRKWRELSLLDESMVAMEAAQVPHEHQDDLEVHLRNAFAKVFDRDNDKKVKSYLAWAVSMLSDRTQRNLAAKIEVHESQFSRSKTTGREKIVKLIREELQNSLSADEFDALVRDSDLSEPGLAMVVRRFCRRCVKLCNPKLKDWRQKRQPGIQHGGADAD